MPPYLQLLPDFGSGHRSEALQSANPTNRPHLNRPVNKVSNQISKQFINSVAYIGPFLGTKLDWFWHRPGIVTKMSSPTPGIWPHTDPEVELNIVISCTHRYKQLFKDPAIAACFAIVIVSEMSVAWVLPTFERFLSLNFNLNASFTGIIFR